MLAVLAKIQDKPLILKGGTALMLCYGLDRFSEDLDFDIQGDFVGKGTINLVHTLKSVTGQNFEVLDVIIKKDTPTVTRYMLRYHDRRENQHTALKIETSYRTPNHDYAIVNGLKTAKSKILQRLKSTACLMHNMTAEPKLEIYMRPILSSENLLMTSRWIFSSNWRIWILTN